MKELRQEVIEAAGLKLYGHHPVLVIAYPDDALEAATVALDAILDCLDDNAEKWESLAVAEFGAEAYWHMAKDLRPFVAALRLAGPLTAIADLTAALREDAS